MQCQCGTTLTLSASSIPDCIYKPYNKKDHQNEYAKYCKAEAISWAALKGCACVSELQAWKHSGGQAEQYSGETIRAPAQGAVSLLFLLPFIFFLRSTKQHNHLALQQQMYISQSIGFSGMCVASCYYDSHLILRVNGCHFLRARLHSRWTIPLLGCPSVLAWIMANVV